MATARRSLLARQRRAAGCPAYLAEFRLVRGRCLKPRCGSRLGVVRVSIDYRSRVSRDVLATVECAKCGRTWRRVKAPKLGEYQSVRLTLILQGDQKRWFARGRYHVEGEDAIVIREATWADLLEAEAAWKRVNEQHALALAKKKVAAEAKAAILHEQTLATIAGWREREAERAADEAAAKAREEAGQS